VAVPTMFNYTTINHGHVRNANWNKGAKAI